MHNPTKPDRSNISTHVLHDVFNPLTFFWILLLFIFISPQSLAEDIDKDRDEQEYIYTHSPHMTIGKFFDKPPQKWLPGHRGVDIVFSDNTPGNAIFSLAPGVITYIGSPGGIPTLTVTLASGLKNTYQPIHTHLKLGDSVPLFQLIGHRTHSSEETEHFHAPDSVHIGLLHGKDYINPLKILVPAPVVLFP